MFWGIFLKRTCDDRGDPVNSARGEKPGNVSVTVVRGLEMHRQLSPRVGLRNKLLDMTVQGNAA